MSSLAGTLFDGMPLWRLRAAAEPDARPRAIALPVDWEEEEGAAVAALAPGCGPVVFPRLAEGWISLLAMRGRKLGILADAPEQDAFAEALRALLIDRRGAPGAAIWRGEAKGPARFVLNLAAFLDPDGTFDSAAYARAVGLGVRVLDIWTGAK